MPGYDDNKHNGEGGKEYGKSDNSYFFLYSSVAAQRLATNSLGLGGEVPRRALLSTTVL